MTGASEAETLYGVLEVTPNATFDEIDAAYARIMAYLGEDALAMYAMLDEPIDVGAQRQRVEEAYRVLSDPALRSAYDDRRHGGSSYPSIMVPRAESGSSATIGELALGETDDAVTRTEPPAESRVSTTHAEEEAHHFVDGRGENATMTSEPGRASASAGHLADDERRPERSREGLGDSGIGSDVPGDAGLAGDAADEAARFSQAVMSSAHAAEEPAREPLEARAQSAAPGPFDGREEGEPESPAFQAPMSRVGESIWRGDSSIVADPPDADHEAAAIPRPAIAVHEPPAPAAVAPVELDEIGPEDVLPLDSAPHTSEPVGDVASHVAARPAQNPHVTLPDVAAPAAVSIARQVVTAPPPVTKPVTKPPPIPRTLTARATLVARPAAPDPKVGRRFTPRVELPALGDDTEIGGAGLRRLRESADASLDDFATVTKISKRYLRALEENDFEALPAEVYIRGFVREYAKVLGLDPSAVAKSYMSLYSRYKEQRGG